MANQDRVGRLFQQVSGNQKAYRVYDDQLVFVDPADATKRVRLDAGSVSTATTRVITVPDFDFTLGGAGSRRNMLLGSANLTLTAAMSGAVIRCGAAEDFVLPALTAALAGINYTWIVTTTCTTFTITAQTGDLLHGGATIMSTGAGVENDAFSADGTDDLIFSMNGTTQGGIIGSKVEFYAYDATTWLVHGNLIGSGTLVTPFS